MTDRPHSPSHKPAQALARHIDVISAAVNDHNGIIDDTPDNQHTIKSLSKAGLGYYVADLGGLNLHTTTVRFVRHFEQRQRFQISGGHIATLLQSIADNAELYRLARHKSPDDGDLFRRQLFDQINELAGALMELSEHFAGQVYEELRVIADLDLRIRANERILTRLSELNDTLSGLTPDHLDEIGARDNELERLLFRRLKPTIDQCQRDTIDAVHRLREDLLQWKKDRHAQQTNHLLDAFSRHYKRHPDYSPDPGILSTAPAPFYHTGLTLHAYADLSDPDAQERYIDFAAKAAAKRGHHHAAQPVPQSTTVTSADHSITETIPPFEQAIIQFFDALQRPDGHATLSAVDTYPILQPGSDLDTWLLAIATHYRDYRDSFAIPLGIEYQEQPVFGYNGNHIVSDLIISRS